MNRFRSILRSALFLMGFTLILCQAGALSETKFSVSILDDTRCKITGCSTNESTVVIPNVIDGRLVTAVVKSAFQNNTTLKRLELADSVEDIENNAFSGCEALESLSLGRGLKRIGSMAFSGCNALREVNAFPEGLTEIGDSAFGGPLHVILLPDSVVSIGSRAFNLSEVEVFRWSGGVETIPNELFRGTPIEKIVIPEGVTAIGKKTSSNQGDQGVFYRCRNLKEVSLPDTLKYIAKYAFSECVALEEIELPNRLESIDQHAFKGCEALRSVKLPDGISQVGMGAFRDCLSLEQVVFGKSLTSLDKDVFMGCEALKAIDLPEIISTVGSGAFMGCKAVRTLALPDSLEVIETSAFRDCKALESLSLGRGLKRIGSMAFSGCNALREVNAFPEGLTEIGDSAFGGPLHVILLPDSVVSIGSHAFNLSEVEVFRWSGGVETIPNELFRGTPIEKIVIPEGVTAIGTKTSSNESDQGVFYRCGNLKEVSLPDTLEFIGKFAFSECASLKKVRLPSRLSALSSYTFSGDGALNCVVMPQSVNSIEETAFRNCPNLVLRVIAGSYGETFAVEHGIEHDYDFKADNTLQLHLETASDIERYAGAKLKLLRNGAERSVVTLNGSRRDYVFADQEPGDGYAVVLASPWGDQLARKDGLSVGGQAGEYTFSVETGMTQATVRLLDPEGKDMTDMASFQWFVDNASISSGRISTMLPVGRKVKVKIQLFNKLLSTYREPAEQTINVPSADSDITVTLESLPRLAVSGRVVDANTSEPVQNAVLTAEQILQGGYIHCTNSRTDANGNYVLDLVDAPYSVTVRRNGYNDYQATSLAKTIRLEPLNGEELTLNITYCAAGTNGPVETAFNNVDLSVSAVSTDKGTAVQTVLQYPRVLLPGCRTGDRLRFTVASRGGAFEPQTADLQLTEKADIVSARLVQNGVARVFTRDNVNPDTFVAIYDNQGCYVASKKTSEGRVDFPNISNGDYTALIMGARPTFQYAPTLDMLKTLGYAEHTDYILQPFRVEAGNIVSVIPAEVIPPVVEDEVGFFKDTNVTVNRQSTVLGNFLTLRASAELAKAYDGAKNLRWLVSIPDGSRYVDGSAMLGNAKAQCTKTDFGLYQVKTSDLSKQLRLCVTPVKEGTYDIHVFLSFSLNDRDYLKPVGSTRFEAKGLTFSTVDYTNSDTIVLNGTAPSRATIYIYDGRQLVCQTQAQATGYWSTPVILEVNSYTTYHPIHVEAQSAVDPSVLVTSSVQLVRHSPKAIVLKSVTMMNTAHPSGRQKPEAFETVFDYTGRTRTTAYYYYWPKYPDFTFLIAFTENDPERISDVRLNIRLSNGKTITRKADYSSEQDGWVVTEKFTASDALPVQLGVDYTADNEFIPRPLEWNLAVDESNIKQQDSDDENKVVYNVQDDDGNILASDTITYEEVSLEEWQKRLVNDKFTQYDSDDRMKYFYVYRDDGKGGSSSCVAMVDDNKATLIHEDIVSPVAEKTMQCFDNLGRPEVQKLADGLQEALEDRQKQGNSSQGGSGCIPYSTDYSDALQGLLDDAGDWISNIIGLDMGTLKEIKGLYDDSKEFYDNINMLMEHKASIKPGISPEVVMDILRGSAKLADFNDTVKMSSLSPDQKEAMYVYGAAGLAMTACVSVSKGLVSTGMKTGKELATINNGIMSAWLQSRMHFTSDDAEYNKLLERLYDNRDAYQDKMDRYSQYCEGLLDNMESIPDKYYGFLGDFLRNNGNICDPTLDSEETKPSLDPSGIVYETFPENGIKGVKVTCIEKVTEQDDFGDPVTYEREWDASEFGQVNPQLTDADGAYGWDVPQGVWRVRYEKEGYETAYSQWMTVPPPQFDVNVSLVSYAPPTVNRTKVYANRVEVSFSKYMRTDSLNESTAQVLVGNAAIPGKWTWKDAQSDPANPKTMLSMKLVFEPEQKINAQATVRVRLSEQLTSYAGVAMQEEYIDLFGVTPSIDELKVTDTVELESGKAKTVTVQAVPGAMAAGMCVQVVPISETIIGIKSETVTLDENGCGSFTVTGKLPGVTQCELSLEGTDVSTLISVSVKPSAQAKKQVDTPVSSVRNNSIVPYGTQVTLSCPTTGAKIYYSVKWIDGSVTNTTQYTKPIVLRKCAVIHAQAKKEGQKDSATITVNIQLDGDLLVRQEKKYAWTKWCKACMSSEALELKSLPGVEIKWSSEDDSIASVDAGRLILKSVGTTDILARDGRYVVGRYTITIQAEDDGLVLPKSMKVIDELAFNGDNSICAVKVPKGALEIRGKAFKNCPKLRVIYIPDSVTVIGKDAFSGCSEELYILGHANSKAEAYAAANGIPFFAIR